LGDHGLIRPRRIGHHAPMPLPLPLLLALTADPPPVERGMGPALGVTALSAGVVGGLAASLPAYVRTELRACRWCAPPRLDAAAWSALRWDAPQPEAALRRRTLAVTLSNVTWGAALLWSTGSLVTAGAVDHRAGWASASDVVLVAEPMLLALALNQVLKMDFGRQRPDVHYQVVDPGGDDDNLSFYSGHTTSTFAAAVAAGTVASLRGYRGAPAVWAGGLTFATATGYLRMAGQRHWLTDVLVGAAVGTALGALVPRLHLVPPEPTGPRAAPAAPPTGFTFGGAF
jgi:membrane-associated phospholipid phosphatase